MFAVRRKKIQLTAYLPLAILLAALVLLGATANSLYAENESKQKDILERALNRSITQCYALEGAYPSSIAYLEENYGLTYDKKSFYIDYQYIGSNLRPDTTIIERD